jgi:NADH:ubiquinone oxidoreductase subunit 6 (subunit J)
LTAQFYHHFEVRAGKPYVGFVSNELAWVHLVLMNVGVAAASILMMYVGYMGDLAISSKEFGGFEMSIEQAAEQILNPYIAPVAAMLLVMVVGAVAGGAGFIINYSSSRL